MFWLKKMIFKVMELGLGLRTCFSLETRNPIFINFKLSSEEVKKVQESLPSGFSLKPMRFLGSDTQPEYWISYNIYELLYPKPELAEIKKARLEINTFVEDAQGRPGIFVFCGSPFVSKETEATFKGKMCDFAEWLVTKIYGCGRLTSLSFSLTDRLQVKFERGVHQFNLNVEVPSTDKTEGHALSADYWRYNDISFFNGGRTLDFVNVNNSFYQARFVSVPPQQLTQPCAGLFFFRAPDSVLVHRGDISYLVNSLNPNLGFKKVYG
jgi:hypothetical protein